MRPSGFESNDLRSSQEVALAQNMSNQSKRPNTTSFFDVVEERLPSSDTFRVTTASAVKVTGGINRLRLSQRMHDIQNDTKCTAKLQDLADPLTSVSDFRGLLLADYKVALATRFSEQKLTDIRNRTLDCIEYDEQMQVITKSGLMDRSHYARPDKAHSEVRRPTTQPGELVRRPLSPSTLLRIQNKDKHSSDVERRETMLAIEEFQNRLVTKPNKFSGMALVEMIEFVDKEKDRIK